MVRDGIVLAETHHPVLLLEGSLPRRYYILREDVRMDLLAMTDTSSHCPFKGDATYYAVKVGDHVVADLAWSYEAPLRNVAAIGGLICFFNEKVDLEVDGERVARPKTQWS